MKFRALTTFTDLQDGGFEYKTGDAYPRDGLEVSHERLEELASSKNKRGVPVIEAVLSEDDSEEATEGLSEFTEDTQDDEAGFDRGDTQEAKRKPRKKTKKVER